MKDEFESAFTLRNLYKALLKCCQGTMWKDGTALYRWDGLENSVKLRKALMNGSYTMQHYMRFRVARPKPRDITATRVRDRHAQRAGCDKVLYDLITRSFIRNNGACQRGRGVDDTINRTKEGLRRMYRKQRQARAQASGCPVEKIGPFEAEGWVYKGDVRKYFPSTLHRNAKAIIRKRLRSPRLAAMPCAVIESFGEPWWEQQARQAGASKTAAQTFSRAVTDARTEREMIPMRPQHKRAAIAENCNTRIRRAVNRLPGVSAQSRAQLMAAAFGDDARGIGLGSQISQLVQLAQLDPIDHYATEVARPAFYIRYMDDFLLIDTDREKLTAAAQEIERRLNALGLELNPKSQLLPLRSGFVFLKWRFHLTPTGKVIMRAAQGVAKEEKRRLRRMVQKAREGKATTQSVRTHYAGWRAHIARGNTRALLKSMDAYLNDLLRDFEKEETNNEH